jgi:hypothetical protein
MYTEAAAAAAAAATEHRQLVITQARMGPGVLAGPTLQALTLMTHCQEHVCCCAEATGAKHVSINRTPRKPQHHCQIKMIATDVNWCEAHHQVSWVCCERELDAQVLDARHGCHRQEAVHVGVVGQADVGNHGALQPAAAAAAAKSQTSGRLLKQDSGRKQCTLGL